ncbi:ABC transporter atnG [Colletotrichum tropicale]|nr:ABC transporter atnG [Colletotrichum tropicale]
MANHTTCPLDSDNRFGPRIAFECRPFDFTLFFEDEIFHVIPAAIFLLLIPSRLFSIVRTPVKLTTYKIALSKLGLLAALGAFHLSFLIVQTKTPSINTTLSLASGILTFVAVLAASLHSILEDQRSTRPSDLLILYFSVSAILALPRLRTLWLIPSASTAKALWTAIFVLTALVVPLESIGKKKFLQPTYQSLTKEEETGFWGRSFFTWLLPFFRLGYSRVIHIHDMPEVDAHLTGETAGQALELSWAARKDQKHHALLRASCRAYRGTIFLGVITRLFFTAFTFCQPFLITATVTFMQTPKTPQSEKYGQALVGAYVLTYIGLAVSRAAYSRQQYRFTTMIRAGLIDIVFRKTVSLKADDLKDSAAVTLMGTDVERIVTTFAMFHEIWASVVEVGVAVFLLQQQIQIASIVPVVISIVCVVGVIPISKTIGRAQTVWIERLQKRVAVTATMLGDMKAIKMLGLPEVLSGVILQLRRVELSGSEKFRKLLLWQVLVSNLPNEFAPFATFVIYSIIALITKDQTLTSTNAFTALSLINLLTDPLLRFCQYVPNIVQGIACFTRIQAFCLKSSWAPEKGPSDSEAGVPGTSDVELTTQTTAQVTEDIITSFQDAAISWSSETDVVLSHLSLRIKKGITMVVGPVGCGKSCLLESILGETTLHSGSLTAPALSIAYCSQNPWILNNTIRHNITGGLEFDAKWFERVLWLCSLTDDVRNMPEEDAYNIGSNGVGLSGGQKQRVALARAIYSRHRVVILDDTFSGLDSRTVGRISTRLFGLDGYFRQNGISVILATHTRHLLRFADEVVVLENGGILSQGPFENVLATSADVVTTSAPPADDSADSISEQDTVPSPNVEKQGKVVVSDNNEADRLRQNGSWLVYKYYFEQGGWVAFSLFVASTITESFCAGFTTIWFQWWVEANGEEPNQDLGMYLGVYALLFLTNMFALILECWVMFIRIINSTATGLHADLLQTSLKFSQDLNLVDMTLPSNAINFFTNSCACVIKVIILCVLGKYLASSIPLLVAVLFFVQRYYLRTSRQVRLLDIEAKAPMYTHFLETLKGVATIRAYGWESIFEAQASALLNRSQKPHYMLACIQQWLALVLDLVVGALALIVVAMATSLTDKFTPGAVGVAMVLVLGFNSDLAVTIKNWTALETSIGAVSRIREFANETPSEERELGSNGAPPAGWPLKGAIKFENVTARYTADAAATLKSLSLDISPGQRIAVCGSSGSGKTSLVLSLLQMIEVTDGRIFIDGIDLSTLERSKVRSHVNVIPQEPFFMPGTVRFNLDPHSRASSEGIKTALDKVGLLSRIGMAGGLDAELEADGFSMGERQLLALARAIISNRQILVLDEATSSVDQETESMMQSIIDREFSEQTVISVIHRLRFVENYDKVLLLSRGEILEWDTPRSLLMRDSEFQKFFTSMQRSH